MKNLNKKIGAIALAGMMVAGGFVASGVSAHAFEFPYPSIMEGGGEDLLNSEDKNNIKEVEEVSNKLGVVLLDASKYSDKMNRFLGKYFPSQKEKLSKSKGLISDNKENLEVQLRGLKSLGEDYVRLKYKGFDYIFLLKSQR